MSKKPFLNLLLISIFLISKITFSQTNLYIYSNKNLLPGDSLLITASAGNYKSQKIHFEVYRITDVKNFLREDIDFLSFRNTHFEKIKNYLELIYTTEKFISYGTYWFSETFSLLKIESKGTFLVRASLDNAQAFTFVTCSNYGLISKRSKNDLLVFLVNRTTSQPIPNTTLEFISLIKNYYKTRTNENGVAKLSLPDRPENQRLLTIVQEKDTTLLLQDVIYSPSYDYQNYLVYTYTNQPIYRPGQKVFFKSIIRKRIEDNLLSYSHKNVEIKIITPDNSEIFRKSTLANQNGSINDSIDLSIDATLGTYTIIISVENENHTQTFEVQEYKKPEFKVLIETNKKSFLPGDTVKITISAEYYFGNKLTSGNVRYEIFARRIVRYWWEFEPFATFYRSCFVDLIPFFPLELIESGKGELTNEGQFKFDFLIPNEFTNDFEYTLITYVADESNREIQGSIKFWGTQNNILITTTPDKYFYKPHELVRIKVITTDFRKNYVSIPFQVIIQKVHSINYEEFYEYIDTLSSTTLKDGIAIINYKPKSEGRYSYIVKVRSEGRLSTSRNYFIVGEKNIETSSMKDGIQIIPAKDVFDESDDIEFLIISPFENVNMLLTLEQSNIYDYKVIKLEGNTHHIKFKKGSFYPSIVHLSVNFFYDNRAISALKKIGIVKKSKDVNIILQANKKEYKPRDRGKFYVKVTDPSGKPIKGLELSASTIDESLLYFISQKQSDIKNYFETSITYKILTSSSETFSISFTATKSLTPNFQVKYDYLRKKGNNQINGVIINEFNNNPIENALILVLQNNYKREVRTNSKGFFICKNLPNGTFDVLISKEGFESKIIKAISLRGDKIYSIGEIYLTPLYQARPQFYEFKRRNDFLYLEKAPLEMETTITYAENGLQTSKYLKPEIRSEFKDAILWEPNIITDEDGIAQFEVNYPDNLTSWLTEVKVAGEDKFGEISETTITRKNIIIRLEAPRYLREKDRTQIISTIHNYTNNNQTIRVTFECDNCRLINVTSVKKIKDISYNTKEIILDSNSVTRIGWQIVVGENVDSIKIRGVALTNIESDGMELTIPVEKEGVPLTSVQTFSITQNKDKIKLPFFISNSEKSKTELKINISPSLFGQIFNALDELVGYPYGCVEQTMSRFLPSIIVANVANELNIKLKEKTIEELPKIIQAGVKRLEEFQHYDGGWGWWQQDETHPYMTAYVVYGLALTKSLGHKVLEHILTNGIESLEKQIINQTKLDERTLSFTLYSLATAIEYKPNNLKTIELIRNNFEKLLKIKNDPYVLAHLILIANKFGWKEFIYDLSQRLIKSSTREGQIVYWGSKYEKNHLVSDLIETTSLAIKALNEIGSSDELIERAIRWIINSRKGNIWYSTKQTASVIMSITPLIKKSKELEADFNVRIFVNDKELESINFSKNNLFEKEKSILIPNEILKNGNNEIKILKSGIGKLYGITLKKTYVKNISVENQKFNVERKYYHILTVKDGKDIINKLEEIKDTVKVGERIFVEIKVKSNLEQEYLMLEDPIVPGFEVMKEHPYEIINTNTKRSYALLIYSTHREIRDKKVSFFVTNFTQKEMTFSYIAYAQLPGIYEVNPSTAMLMYYPDVSGYSSTSKIIIIE